MIKQRRKTTKLDTVTTKIGHGDNQIDKMALTPSHKVRSVVKRLTKTWQTTKKTTKYKSSHFHLHQILANHTAPLVNKTISEQCKMFE